jgi:hypothetical protein
LSRSLRLRVLRQSALLLEQKLVEVTRDEELVGQDAQRAERRSPFEGVAHQDGWAFFEELVELVDVPQAGEHPRDHLIDETVGSLELHDLGGQALADAEVDSFEGYPISQLEKAGQLAGDDALSGTRSRELVSVHATSKVEAQLDRSVDLGFDDEGRHGSGRSKREP